MSYETLTYAAPSRATENLTRARPSLAKRHRDFDVNISVNQPCRPRVKYVTGPDGRPLTMADLPAPATKRWVIRRKAQVVAAVRGGLLSLEEARSRYALTTEEFLVWQRSIDQHGLAGLRTTRIQQYASNPDRLRGGSAVAQRPNGGCIDWSMIGAKRR